LFAYRQFPAFLCITSLLVGNMMGWLHVGCVDSVKSCHELTDSKLADVGVRQHGCCHHAHEEHRSDGKEDKEDSQPVSSSFPDECPQEHDSESCSICQSFFSLRTAAFSAEPALNVCSDVPEFTNFLAVCPASDTSLPASISVRGPPQV